MELHILGGGNEVGASCSLLSIDGSNILVDAGIRMNARTQHGAPQDALPDLARLQDLGGVEAVVVTHAHTDHIGALPLVHQAYPKAPIYATSATIDLMQILLADALRLMQDRAEREMELPLYDACLVERMFAELQPVPFGRPTRLLPTPIVAQYFPSGHILGAAAVSLHGTEGTALMTGDISMTDQRTIPGMLAPPVKPDLMVVESTYGDRLHANRRDEELRLARKVADVIGRGGKALIPAFAVGRAQEVILILQAFQREGVIPRCRIWVDGMVRSVCDVYGRHPDLLTPFLRRRMEEEPNPFYWKNGAARAVSSAKQRGQILAGDPCVIVSSSGMLTGGPSQFYASEIVRREENAILITGYQDEEAPGRRLIELAKGVGGFITLGESEVPVLCEVSAYGLSAHADGGEIARLAAALAPEATYLVHGDDAARSALQRLIEGAVVLPQNGESFKHEFSPKANREPSRPGVGRGERLTEENLRRLWEAALSTAPSRGRPRPLRTAELAALWHGTDFTTDGLERIEALIASNQPYFQPDRRRPYLYHAVSRALVGKVAERTAQMEKIGPAIRGRLLLVADEAGGLAPAICFEVAEEGFHAWRVGESETYFPAESYRAVVGPFPAQTMGAAAAKQVLRNLQDAARSLWRVMDLGAVRGREGLRLAAAAQALGFPADSLIHRLAVSWLFFGGVASVDAVKGASGEPTFSVAADAEIPDDARSAVELPLEQNAAFALIDAAFPIEAGLYRKGADRDRGALILSFHFPKTAVERRRETLDLLSKAVGWEIEVNPSPHHGELAALAKKLAARWQVIKEPAIHLDRNAVAVTVAAMEASSEVDGAKDAFLKSTGFALEIEAQRMPAAHEAAAALEEGFWTNGPLPGQIEINESFAIIERRFRELGVSLHKKSKKLGPRGPYIELTFLTPEIGARHRDVIDELMEFLRWPISVNPRPNQMALQELATSLVSFKGQVVKPPSFLGEQKLLRMRVAGLQDEEARRTIEEAFEKETGYRLALEAIDASRTNV